jgi:hypothetical protein
VDAAIVMRYRGVVPGRELDYMRFGDEAGDFWRRMAAAGRCSEPEFFVSFGNEGMYVIRGDFAALTDLLQTPEAQRLFARMRPLMPDFEVDMMLTGAAADRFSEYWLEQVQALLTA